MSDVRRQAEAVAAEGILASDWKLEVEPVRVNRPTVDGRGAVGMMAEAHEDHIIHLTLSATAIKEAEAGFDPNLGVNLGFSVKDRPPILKR